VFNVRYWANVQNHRRPAFSAASTVSLLACTVCILCWRCAAFSEVYAVMSLNMFAKLMIVSYAASNHIRDVVVWLIMLYWALRHWCWLSHWSSYLALAARTDSALSYCSPVPLNIVRTALLVTTAVGGSRCKCIVNVPASTGSTYKGWTRTLKKEITQPLWWNDCIDNKLAPIVLADTILFRLQRRSIAYGGMWLL
jgi:hypothetical protein